MLKRKKDDCSKMRVNFGAGFFFLFLVSFPVLSLTRAYFLVKYLSGSLPH
jgi:hypothetical protein